jgi:DNA-binding GntR family transcriptional regulator
MNGHEKIEPRTQQERVYARLREAILNGQFLPGHSVTLRGVAKMLDVSPMPVREALRRLTTERALELQANRRIAVPLMTLPKLQEIVDARVALETGAAARALDNIDGRALDLLRTIDENIDRAIAKKDTLAYIQGNYRFHFTLYGFGVSEVTIPLIESLWLQTAPFMRLVLERYGLGDLPDRHRDATQAIANGSEQQLRQAIELDIREGPGGIGQQELDETYQPEAGGHAQLEF